MRLEKTASHRVMAKCVTDVVTTFAQLQNRCIARWKKLMTLSWSKIRTNQIARIIWHIVKTTSYHLRRIKLWEARFCKGRGLQERERSVKIPCWRRAGNKNLAYQVRIVHNIWVIPPLCWTWWLGPVYSKLSNSYSNFCWYLNIFALLRFELTGQIIFYST